MELECNFAYDPDGIIYCCFIQSEEIPTNGPLIFSGDHEVMHQNENVREIRFVNCTMLNIPQGLTKTFPNLEDLTINRSDLKNLRKKDLAEYKLLKRIYISRTLIEFVPGDLFKGFENLEVISFYSNKLKIIEPNILNGLHHLEVVDISNNPNYKTFYSIFSDDDSNATLEEVKNELNQVFLENFIAYKDIILKKCEGKMQKKVKKQERLKPQKDISSDIKSLIHDDKFKDFKIQVGDREFHVHKFLLTARSPTFAEIILNNPEVENLNLVDIPVDIFETILKFLYTDEFPSVDDLNDLRLFAAAGRLKIDELKNFAATHVINQIDGNNALEILKLSNKYEHVELRQKAFDEIKKRYPKIMLNDMWAMEPKFVENIIEKFKKKEEMIQNIEKKFQDELLSDCIKFH